MEVKEDFFFKRLLFHIFAFFKKRKLQEKKWNQHVELFKVCLMVKNFARSTGVHYFSFISSFVCYRLPPCSTMSDFTSRTWPLEPSWGPFPSFGPGRETRHSWTHSLFLSFALKGLILNRHSLFIHSRLRYLNLILEAIVAIKSVQAKKQHCRIQEDSFVQSD